MKSGDGKFQIVTTNRDDDSYFYSDTDESFHVLSAEFGDELFRFSGHSYSGRSGTTTGGIEHVDFDGPFVVAHPYEGRPERVELPVKLELADGGNALILTWANGRREKRERREAIATTKYGQPFSLMQLVRKPVDA